MAKTYPGFGRRKPNNRGRRRGGNRRFSGRGNHKRGSSDGPSWRAFHSGADTWRNSSIPSGFADFDDGSVAGRRSYISPESVEDFYFGHKEDRGKQSMRMGGFRPGYREYSSLDLRQETSSFRKRPMQFIKSKEVYDPAHDMIAELRKKNANERVDHTEDEDQEHNDETPENNKINTEAEYLKQGDKTILQEIPENTEQYQHKKDADLFFIDDEGDSNFVEESVASKVIDEPVIHLTDNLEFNPDLKIGKVELSVDNSSNDKEVVVKINSNHTRHPFSNYISKVMKQLDQDEGEITSEDEQEHFEDDITVEPEHKALDSTLSHDIENLIIEENPISASSTPLATEKNPDFIEFGFLEEDFVVNTSEVIVSNIRLGATENSYFLKCYRLFGDHIARWVTQDVLSDFVIDTLGLPYNRLEAYLEHVKNLLIPKTEPPEPFFSSIPFSDTDEEENTDSSSILGDDMREGLDDLVSYAVKYEKERTQEYETSSLRTTGKGKKKKLLIDESLAADRDVASMLEDKFSTRSKNKAKKRRTKEDYVDMENRNSKDLFLKYPHGLHVLNIRDEFEDYFRSERDSLSFPPLDAHGNKTVMKFANHYNMKSSKVGSGNKIHVVVQKVRKTMWSTPNYNIIDNLTRQRPVFMRIDVRKPREEHVGTEHIRVSKGKFHVKEGDIVGKGAPVIGRENIGRQMLEKLGWTAGEGLGVHGNKGISEPLFATVKKSKAGLKYREG